MHITIFRTPPQIDRHRIIRSSAMAQLPPRIPSSTVPMSAHWTGFARNPPPSSTSSSSSSSSPMLPSGFLAATAASQGSSQPSWVDEFLDYSAARRSHHRRSVSDSVAFLEAPPLMDDDAAAAAAGEFDRLDDDQLMYMFSDDMTAAVMMEAPPSSSSASKSSSPSDCNVKNEEKPATAACSDQIPGTNELEEAQSACKLDMAATEQLPAGSSETITDPKRVKRILANRQSAQRSRVRKLQYISELERSVTTLQSEVSALSPRVAFLDHQRTILTVGNSQLKQRIAALAQDKIFKDAHQEALRKEIGRLRQVYNQQNVKMMITPTSDSITCTEKELLC